MRQQIHSRPRRSRLSVHPCRMRRQLRGPLAAAPPQGCEFGAFGLPGAAGAPVLSLVVEVRVVEGVRVLVGVRDNCDLGKLSRQTEPVARSKGRESSSPRRRGILMYLLNFWRKQTQREGAEFAPRSWL